MIVLAVFAMIGIAPFGGYSLAVIDAKQQYIQFSGFLVNVLKNGESLLYSWKQILGGPLAGLFGYYLASPFELLFLLFSQEQLLSAFDLVIALKLALCGFTMALYFRGTSALRPGTLVFTTAYALCGFNLVLGWCAMWLDAVYMLPLIALGLTRIAEDKSPVLYTVSLGLAILFHYYMGYMLCIFSLIFYLYLRMCEEERIRLKKKDAFFCAASFGAACLSAVLLLPVIGAMRGDTGESIPDSIRRYTYPAMTRIYQLILPQIEAQKVDRLILPTLLAVSVLFVIVAVLMWRACRSPAMPTGRRILLLLLGILWIQLWQYLVDRYLVTAEYMLNGERTWVLHKAFFGEADFDELCTGSANIYVGPLALLLSAGFLFNRKFSFRERGAGLLVLILFYASFFFFFPSKVWHLMSETHFFNFRYSFCCSFILLILAEKNWRNIESLHWKTAFLLTAAAVSLGAASAVLARKYLSLQQIYIDLLLLLCSGASLFQLLKSGKKQYAAACIFLQMIAVIYTTTSNYSYQAGELSLTGTAFREALQKGNERIAAVRELDEGYYRTRNDGDWLSKNDPMLFDFLGSSHFSSAEKRKNTDFMESLGIKVFRSRWASGNFGQSRAADAFLGVRYMFAPFADYDELQPGIYANPYDLSLAMVVPDTVQDESLAQERAAENLNSIYHTLGTGGDVFTENSRTVEQLDNDRQKLTFRAEESGYYYLQMDNGMAKRIDARINGVSFAVYEDTWEEDYFYPNQLMLLDGLEKGDLVELLIEPRPEKEMPGVFIYRENTEVLRQAREQIRARQAKLSLADEANLSITATAETEGECLMLSMPYDKAWKITVDGVRTEPVCAFGELLAIPLSGGSHEISMRYYPAGLTAGIAVTSLTVLGMLTAAVIDRKRKTGCSAI